MKLTDIRYTMWATIIPRLISPGESAPAANHAPGRYEFYSDDDSGEVRTRFVPGAPGDDTQAAQYEIKCYARGYTALGYRSSANRKLFVGGDYDITEAIQFDYPSKYTLSHQTLVTNIRRVADPTCPSSDMFFLNLETGQPLVWEIQGVTPVHDPFGKLLRNTTVLKRAEIQ